MNLSIPPHLHKLITERVRSGRYASAEAVLAAAIANLDQQERLIDLAPSALELLFPSIRQKLAQGLAEARAGKLHDGDAFFNDLERDEQQSKQDRKSA